MGVTGLWRLIEPAGKPVPVETLENKVLAVDISIWLHQMVKGYQDAKGAPLPNAHLMGLFQRLCKLLYFRIKPVFVFDGGFPELKKETISKRQHSKAKYHSESERIKRELALLLSKKSAISVLLGKEISPKKGHNAGPANDEDLFKLPALPENKDQTESESEDEHSSSSSSIVDLHSIDVQSEKFRTLPVKEKYDLLIELKETRKMSSWGKIHELPKKSDNFSDFQMQRLLKRRKVQECIEETEKEMGDGGMSLLELESLLNEEGIDTKIESIPTHRIASNNTTRYLLINNVKEALLNAKKKKEEENKPGPSNDLKAQESSRKESEETKQSNSKKDELDDDIEKAIKMSLECHSNNTSNVTTSKTDDSWTSMMTDSDYSEHTDSEEGDGYEQPDMSCAKGYIMQYSDFTNKAIEKIVATKNAKSNSNLPRVGTILEEINKEKSVIIDNVELSSDEECKQKCLQKDSECCDDLTTVAVTKSINDGSYIDSTQSSVIFVENKVDNIISLDLSTDNNDNSGIANIHKLSFDEEYKKKDLKEVNKSSDIFFLSNDVDATQSSVIFVENKMNDIIILDTSTDENIDDFDCMTESPKKISVSENASSNVEKVIVKEESDSNEDEFEDVPGIESEVKQPIVQLILDINQKCDEEEDIFADIFTNNDINPIKDDTLPLTKTDIEVKQEVAKHEEPNNFSNDKSDNSLLIENKSCTNPEIEPFSNVGIISASKKDPLNNITLEKENISFSIPNTPETNGGNADSNKIEKRSNNIINTEIDTNKAIGQDTNDVQGNKDVQEADKNKIIMNEIISNQRLTEMVEEVANEEQDLMQEKGRLDRIGRNITEQMTKEAQELLQIFGVPYIVAPMEAEAQCAFLENLKLTDGTITDDSDIWLFGGKTVYKNFFNQKKHVLQYLSERIERSFNLTREQLILLALLVGSDYTTGVDGVGPVTAMEILASFPYNKKKLVNETSKQARFHEMINGLEDFKKWVRAGKRTDNTSLKKKLKNVNLSEDFPSVRVVQAYLEPNVEKSEEKFSWGEVDITILRDYTRAKFGWSQNKFDEIIKPVLKRMLERKSQKTVHDYFKRKIEYQPLDDQMSKRVKAAVQKMGPKVVLEDEPDTDLPTKQTRKRKTGSTDTKRKAGPSKASKIVKRNSNVNAASADLMSQLIDGKSAENITIPKFDRFQEIIPQREKEKQCLLQNKLKAIETFRKTKIDRKKKLTKKKILLPKEKADLSESSDDN